jgi:hypothetical protein
LSVIAMGLINRFDVAVTDIDRKLSYELLLYSVVSSYRPLVQITSPGDLQSYLIESLVRTEHQRSSEQNINNCSVTREPEIVSTTVLLHENLKP